MKAGHYRTKLYVLLISFFTASCGDTTQETVAVENTGDGYTFSVVHKMGTPAAGATVYITHKELQKMSTKDIARRLESSSLKLIKPKQAKSMARFFKSGAKNKLVKGATLLYAGATMLGIHKKSEQKIHSGPRTVSPEGKQRKDFLLKTSSDTSGYQKDGLKVH